MSELLSMTLFIGLILGMALFIVVRAIGRWLAPRVLPARSLRPLNKAELKHIASPFSTASSSSQTAHVKSK